MDKVHEEFVIGIIELEGKQGKKKVEALNLYDPIARSGHLQSMDKITQRMIKGDIIHGLRLKQNIVYSKAQDKYITRYQVNLCNSGYDTRKLPIINGKKEVLVEGKDAIVGVRDDDGYIKYIAVNNNYEIRYLTRKQLLQEDLYGTVRGSLMKPSNRVIEGSGEHVE